MKYIEKYQTITLEDNKKYAVIDSIIYEDNNFIYITNTEDLKDQLIALATKENDELRINIIDSQSEKNKELLNNLSKLFINSFIDDVDLEGLNEE